MNFKKWAILIHLLWVLISLIKIKETDSLGWKFNFSFNLFFLVWNVVRK